MPPDFIGLVNAWNRVLEQGWAAIVFVMILLSILYAFHKHWISVLDAYKGFTGRFAREIEQTQRKHAGVIEQITRAHERHISEIEQSKQGLATDVESLKHQLDDAWEGLTNTSTRAEKAESQLKWVK